MRRHLRFALPAAAAVFAAAAATTVHHAALTIVLEFQGPHSDRSVAEMKREVEGLMQGAGLTFNWRTPAEATEPTLSQLVVVRFKGKCVLEPVGYLYDERGPLAFTYSADGAIQPFSEVACDHVTASVRSAMFGGDFAHADQLLGRALGRVVAHELVHILAKSGAHGHEGVAKPALSGSALISPGLHLDPADLERIYTQP